MLKNEQRIAEDQGYGIVPIREEMLARPETQEQADTVIKGKKKAWTIGLIICLRTKPSIRHGSNILSGTML